MRRSVMLLTNTLPNNLKSGNGLVSGPWISGPIGRWVLGPHFSGSLILFRLLSPWKTMFPVHLLKCSWCILHIRYFILNIFNEIRYGRYFYTANYQSSDFCFFFPLIYDLSYSVHLFQQNFSEQCVNAKINE